MTLTVLIHSDSDINFLVAYLVIVHLLRNEIVLGKTAVESFALTQQKMPNTRRNRSALQPLIF